MILLNKVATRDSLLIIDFVWGIFNMHDVSESGSFYNSTVNPVQLERSYITSS